MKIISDDIIETMSFFDSWEEKYRYIIELGKELPNLDECDKTDENLIRGCQSSVWLVTAKNKNSNVYMFKADSDAFIVKGLIAIVLSVYNDKTAEEILSFKIEDYFAKLELLSHLSSTRANGIKAMIERITDLVK